MFAAIPFFGLTVYELPVPWVGTIPLDPWAILVCLGFLVGLEIARHRTIRLGLDPKDTIDGAVFTVIVGFILGHVFTVLFYFPERLHTEGAMALVRVWTGFSSIGGFFGAIVGSVVFYRWIRPRPFWRYADIISFGFPFGWVFGRLGCGLVHDHIGLRTYSPLGMDFDRGYRNFVWQATDPYPWATGVRHELGLYEMALTVPICIAFWLLGRKDRTPGFFTALFALLYTPMRFGLDFLRNNDLPRHDLRYAGLTPAQWGCLVLFALALALWVTIRQHPAKPWPMDGQPDQARRALAATTHAG